MTTRDQRAPHPHLVARTDLEDTGQFEPVLLEKRVRHGRPTLILEERARHRRPTLRMSPHEIERMVAETAPARDRLARGSTPFETQPAMRLATEVNDLDNPYEPVSFLSFGARHPWVATVLTVAVAVSLLLALHHIISAA